MSEIAILAEGLTKTYGLRRGLDSLDLAIRAGTLYGFLGPNGAGKTTAVRLFLGLMRPSAGKATVLGYDAWRDGDRMRAEVGYIPGDFRFYPYLSLRSALRMFGQIRRTDILERGLALAERFRLEPDVPTRRMSRGMRQKLGLILALAHDPRLLILDEPTTALDPPMQQTLYAVVRERVADGTTVFFSSHTLSEVEALCERVGILREGRLVANEALDALRERAKRVVRIEWRTPADAVSADVPEFLELDARNERTWTCDLVGGSHELLAWGAGRPIADISIGRPDLDTLFRAFYQDVTG